MSSMTISENPSQWVKDILTRFHNEYPELENESTAIGFNQKNEKTGTAVGSLTMKKWNVVLPIIIKEFQLFPLDVAVASGKILPFNKETVEILFSVKGAFRGVSAGQDDPTELRRVFGKGMGDIQKTSEYHGSVLEGLNGKISDKSRDLTVAKMKELKFDESVIEKVSSLVGDIPNFYTIEKTGKWDYKVRMGKYGEAIEWIDTVDEANLPIFKEKMEKTGAVEGNPAHFEVEWEKTAVFSSNISDFDGSDLGLYLEFNKEADYAISDKLGEFTPIDEILETSKELSVGDYGLFKFANGSVSKPFSIESADDNGVYSLFDGLSMVKVGFLNNVAEVVEEDGEYDANYYYPTDTKFVKLGKLVEDFNRVDQVKVANASAVLKGGEYSFYGEPFNKVASENLGFEEARWMWLKMGGTDEEFTKISEDRRYVIQASLAMPKSEGEAIINDTFLKLAADVGEGSVDALLGLNFMSKKNIKYFVEKIPLFESAASELAYLLIGSRLGVNQINGDATKEAMDQLSAVVKNLYQLEALGGKK